MRVSAVVLWGAAGVAVALAAIALATVLRSPDRAGDAGPTPRAPPTAASFAESVGVNVHLSYTGTPYEDVERVVAALHELGVRHVRDGLVPQRPDQYDRLNRLAEAGIRADLILGAPNVARPSEQIATLKANLAGAVEAVEGPNEYDLSGSPQWADALVSYQRELFTGVNADPRLDSLPVLGPTIVMPANRGVLADVRTALDVANIHPYAGGGPPEPAIEQGIADARQTSGDVPLVASETGYHNAIHATEGQPPVDELTAADYLPRLLLSAFDGGIRRTYWYELVDVAADPAATNADSNFGLLRSDFSPKPAFAALANLMRLARGGDASPGRPLELSVSEPPDEVRRLLLQKRKDVYLLILWRPLTLFDTGSRRRIDERSVDVSVAFARRAAAVTVHRPSRSPSPIGRMRGVDRINVPVGGDVVILELSLSDDHEPTGEGGERPGQ